MNKKQIYFFVDPIYGSSYLRGEQIAIKLKQLGYDVYLIKKIDGQIKNSIIFMIKDRAGYSDYFHESNFLIWDLIDFVKNEETLNSFVNHSDKLNLIIYHNNIFPKYLSENFNVKTDFKIIPHHWDERIKSTVIPKKSFKIGYIGDMSSSIFLNLIESKESTSCKNSFRDSDFLNKYKKYNCHFDMKRYEGFKFKLCSSIKLSTAAALNCGIIINKTWSNLYLLPEDYILYCDATTEGEVINKINETKELFYSSKWQEIIDPLKKIKELTNIDNIVKLYEEIINEH